MGPVSPALPSLPPHQLWEAPVATSLLLQPVPGAACYLDIISLLGHAPGLRLQLLEVPSGHPLPISLSPSPFPHHCLLLLAQGCQILPVSCLGAFQEQGWSLAPTAYR